jgi:hypothetical protein
LTPEFLKVKYLVKLFVHIYMFISYYQCAWNFSINTRIHSMQFPELYAFQEGNS